MTLSRADGDSYRVMVARDDGTMLSVTAASFSEMVDMALKYAEQSADGFSGDNRDELDAMFRAFYLGDG